MAEGICLLCCESLQEEETVFVRNGMATLIQASHERKYGKHETMVKADGLTVHAICRKSYTRRDSIKASSSKEVGEPAPKVPCLRPREFRFDYKKHCLFCCDVVESPNLKLPKHRRRQIRTVETKEIADYILKACESRNDEFGEKIRTRVTPFTNLVAEETKYHLDCYLEFRKIKIHEKSGRPEEKSLDNIFSLLFNYLEENIECQYSSVELKKVIKTLPGGEDTEISDYLLKSRLKAKYGTSVIFTDVIGKPTVFSFLGTAHNILCNQWYENREKFEQSERLRIVKTAAAIIKEDIRAKVYDIKNYPTFEDMEDGGKDLIPESLNLFMNCVLPENNKSTDKGSLRQVTINHAIISSCRPRSFISPLYLGLSVHLHAKYASRYLVDTLNSLGVCCSYSETLKYINCAGSFAQPTIDRNAFVQYVFDNADVNTKTLDGFGTVHILGGVRCVTPKDSVTVPSAIPRKDANTVQTQDIPIKPYTNQLKLGLKKVIIKDFSDVIKDIEVVKQELKLDLLWMAGFVHSNHLPSWNGYMQKATRESGTFQTSRIMPLPFVNLQANNLTTLHSALSFASSECAKTKQKCIVTFDQPLFLKSSEIVAAANENDPLSSIIVRLGGFHCLMSFLGCIGQNMTGSGLEQLWETVYAKNTIPHLVTGRAYARSLRAHILTLSALYSIMSTRFPILKESENIIRLCEELYSNQISSEEVKLSSDVTHFCNEFESKCEEAKAMGRTPKLWIQYFKQVVLVLQFIRAERTGNWDLHISTVTKMLPYFHSAGHVLYAKSAHLYLQKMYELESQLSPREFSQFTSEGFFTIRRSETFWNGTWSDMIIEQCLMRSMKSIGGLTHVRGITHNTLMRWVNSAPVSVEVALAFQKFTGLVSYSSEQHVEERSNRQARDRLDKQKFIDWMQQHNPLEQRSDDLVSLSSGLVADCTIDCDEAFEKGLTSMLSMIGKHFDELVIPRKNKVKNMSSMNSSIKVRGNEIEVNSQQLFNRIVCVVKEEKDLKECFKYELAPTPPSLFDDVSMRKGKKSSIVAAFVMEEITKVDKCTYVLDGGHLLHSVVWPRPATYKDVIINFTSHVISRYGDDCIIVFDGYPDHQTTKGIEQERRASRRTSADINIREDIVTTTTQMEFLANNKNKKLFIKQLSTELRRQGVNVIEAEADADVTIVTSAIEKARDGSRVVVVGQDTDLLILLTTSSTDEMNLWFLRPGSQKKRSSIFFIPKQRQVHKNVLNCLLFLHAITGCDTKSALFKKSKIKGLHMLQKDPSLRQTVAVFNEVSADHEAISTAGEKFLLDLYGAKTSQSLDEYRYFNYNHVISRQQLHSKFQLAVLPPTRAAAANHSYRTYLQVQQWMGNNLEPTDWGWQFSHGKLKPVATHQDPAPSKLLNLVSCGCKSGCSKRCECVRAGLKCSAMCGWCQGLSCSNAEELVNDDDID